MKKRIGSRIYDTDSAELVTESGIGTVYRKRTRGREWFMVIGERIEPLTDDEARAIIGESAYRERQPDPDSWMIRVDRETHDRIADEASRTGRSMTEIVRRLSETLV